MCIRDRLLRDDGQHPEHHPNQNGQDVNKLIIDFCKDPKSVHEIMDEFDFDSRTSFRRKYLTPMLKNGVLKTVSYTHLDVYKRQG